MTALDVPIVYGQLRLPQVMGERGEPITHPYEKPPRPETSNSRPDRFSVDHPVSECEVRASTYLAAMLGRSRSLSTRLISDIDANPLLDANILALGGPGSNYKSEDIIGNPANTLICVGPNRLSRWPDTPLDSECTTEVDHGVILRVTPPEFPNRSWTCCAGLGEWGTSGSAWFLAHNWQLILRTLAGWKHRLSIRRAPDFAAVVRVVRGQDQSARLVALFVKTADGNKKVA